MVRVAALVAVVVLGACGGRAMPRPDPVDVGACAYLRQWASVNGHAPPRAFVDGWLDGLGAGETAAQAEIGRILPRPTGRDALGAVAVAGGPWCGP